MPRFAMCSSLVCSYSRELPQSSEKRQREMAPTTCPQCGKPLILKCWFCGSPIISASVEGALVRCEVCRVELRRAGYQARTRGA